MRFVTFFGIAMIIIGVLVLAVEAFREDQGDYLAPETRTMEMQEKSCSLAQAMGLVTLVGGVAVVVFGVQKRRPR